MIYRVIKEPRDKYTRENYIGRDINLNEEDVKNLNENNKVVIFVGREEAWVFESDEILPIRIGYDGC